MKNIRINILSPGRFHVCDLARELDKQGFDVRFYSFVPTWRAKKFGLPGRCSSSVFLFMLPFLVIEKIVFKKKRWASTLKTLVQDFVTGIYMRECDVLIAMSGSFVYSVKKAKKRGAVIILERGSKYILEQKRILEEIPSLNGIKTVPNINVKRELAGYQLADYIAIASQHVKRSFMLHNYPLDKLFINPYGVDLTMFKPLPSIEKKYDIIMVGGWSYRKGCDIISEAIPKTKYSFLHVGSIVDCHFPINNQMIHVDAVDQTQLVNYYNQAKIFILPSREEGLAMVQAQAIACNLPLIGSPDSGAEDLRAMVSHPEYIAIVEEYSCGALIKAIDEMLDKYHNMNGIVYAGNTIENLTWEAYGKRYTNFVNKILTCR